MDFRELVLDSLKKEKEEKKKKILNQKFDLTNSVNVNQNVF